MIQQLPAMPRLRALTRFPADSRVMVYPQTAIVNCSFLLHPAKYRRFLLYLSIQGSQSEPLRRVRVACKATSSFPHACASFNSVGDCLPPPSKVCYNSPPAEAGDFPAELKPNKHFYNRLELNSTTESTFFRVSYQLWNEISILLTVIVPNDLGFSI